MSLKRHGISRLPKVEGEASPKTKFKSCPIGFFHIDIAEVRTAEGKLYMITRKIVGRPELADGSRCRSRGLAGLRISASASVAGSSTRCMLPRSSELAKARSTNRMSSATWPKRGA